MPAMPVENPRVSFALIGVRAGKANPLDENPAPRWAGPLFLFLAVALVPWIIYLALTLPNRTIASHYRIAWVGFDVALVVALARTAWLALKGKRQMEIPAVVSATLLVVDAWFDIMTSRPGAAQMEALFLAVFVELPTAFLALYLSRRVEQVIDQTLARARGSRSMLQARLPRRLARGMGGLPGVDEDPSP